MNSHVQHNKSTGGFPRQLEVFFREIEEPQDDDTVREVDREHDDQPMSEYIPTD